MDLMTYAALRKYIKGLVASGGITNISSEGNTLTFTLASGETTSVEIPSPEISINENGMWVINGVNTEVSAIPKMILHEY